MEKLLDVAGQYRTGGESISFSLVIFSPKKDPDSGDYYCQILSPELFSSAMNVFGVTPKQSARLAFKMVNAKLVALITRPFSDEILEG